MMGALRNMAYALLILALFVLVIGYGCSRTHDRYLTCRSLGHGKVYCSISAMESDQ